MKKTYLLWFAVLAFLLVGCRNDNFNPNDANNNQQALKFRTIPKSEIPEIMTSLQSKTDNFKIPLKSISTQGKTETAFGDIITDYIIESVNENNEKYYIFPVFPKTGNDVSEIYNLEIKADGNSIESSTMVAYLPTSDWISNGNNDFSTFSGVVNTYSLDGNLEASVEYLTGSGTCNPQPCPDCPANPQGPGNPGGGGGYPPTQGGSPPTGPGGPIGYLGGSGPSGPSTPSCGWFAIITDNVIVGAWNSCTGQVVYFYLINGNNNYLTANTFTGRIPCNGSGGIVIAPGQKTSCQKTKDLITNISMLASISLLKNNATSGTGEQGFKADKTGAASPIINGGAHNVDFGDKTGYAGGYHNHTKTGIPMLSPGDIDQLLGFARAQGDKGDPTNAFVGMVAPNGMHYVIRFSGSYQDAINSNFMQDDLDKLIDDYVERESKLTNTILNGFNYINNNGSINSKGVEKLLLDTLKKMGLSGKIGLQRIESDGTIQNIYLDNNNQPIPVPCP